MKNTLIFMLAGALLGIVIASFIIPPALVWYSEPGGLPGGASVQALVQIPLGASDPEVPATAAPFLTGFENPMAVVAGPDGALYAGDWSTGAIYRVAPA